MSSEIENIQKVLRGESQKESEDIGNVVQEERKIEGEISGIRKNEDAIKAGLEQMDQSYKGQISNIRSGDRNMSIEIQNLGKDFS